MHSLLQSAPFAGLLLIATLFSSCKCSSVSFGCPDYEMDQAYTSKKIYTGPGTEDIALDTSRGYPRLIVSCDERRDTIPVVSGSFYAINLETGEALPFTFDQDPSTLYPNDTNLADWHPHGIALARIDGTDYLYSVTHRGKKKRDFRSNEILRFRIGADTLFYDTTFTDGELRAPNDIFVLSDGSFYVSNILKNSSTWQFIRGAFGARTGNIVYYNPESGIWDVAIPRQAYPNGIYVDEEARSLYMVHGACKEVNRYSIAAPGMIEPESKTTSPQKITMGDNLTRDSEGYLWTTSHPCLFRFLKHSKKRRKHSPSLAYRIDPNTLEAELVFQDNGSTISAASTALWYGGKLYLSQVFEDFVLEVNLAP